MAGWPDSKGEELVWGGGEAWCPFPQQTSAHEGMTWHRAQEVRRWDSQKSAMRGSEAEWWRLQQIRSSGFRLAVRQASQMQRLCSLHKPASRVPRRGRLSTPGGTMAQGVEVQSVGCKAVVGHVGGGPGASAGVAEGETSELGAQEEEEEEDGSVRVGVLLGAAARGFCRARASHSAVRFTRSGG